MEGRRRLCPVQCVFKTCLQGDKPSPGGFWIEGKAMVTQLFAVMSVGRSSQHETLSTVLARGHIDSMKRLMTVTTTSGGVRSQRSLSRSRWCNNHKVFASGRDVAIQKFSDALRADPFLASAAWTLSACQLVCRCTPNQRCHGDVIIEAYRSLFSLASDHDQHRAAHEARVRFFWVSGHCTDDAHRDGS